MFNETTLPREKSLGLDDRNTAFYIRQMMKEEKIDFIDERDE
jgi:hypothetical protein